MSEFREAAEDWFAVAERDLTAARVLLSTVPSHIEVALFHVQQLVEKVMKAMLVLEGIDPPRTHDLEKLSELLPLGRTLPSSLPPLRTVSNWQVLSRYPDADLPDTPIPSPEEALRFVDDVDRLMRELR